MQDVSNSASQKGGAALQGRREGAAGTALHLYEATKGIALHSEAALFSSSSDAIH